MGGKHKAFETIYLAAFFYPNKPKSEDRQLCTQDLGEI